MENRYEIAFVGAGISAAYTLIHYISELKNKPAKHPVRIVVLEKSGEFWKGVPYGKQSGYNPLIITSIKEFIPQQPERNHFIDWLKANQDWVFENPQQKEGELSLKWHKAHKEAIANGCWDDLFIPRYIFGLYIQDYLETVLKEAKSNGTIEISMETATVTDIQFIDNQYQIQVTTNSEPKSFVSEKLVLAVGSPPNIGFGQSPVNEGLYRYITNMYEPSIDRNICRICDILEQVEDAEKRRILIVGSNAGTLDTLFALINSERGKRLVHKFIILSPNGAFPHRISREPVEIQYIPNKLIALAKTNSFTAKQILEAVQQEVAAASTLNLNISDIFPSISHAMIEALDLLNVQEQEQFVSKYAVEIGKMQRRAGGEYLDVVDSLVACGKLEFLKGRFVNYVSLENGEPGVEYIPAGKLKPELLTESIALVVSCAGFQEVTGSSSELIQNLIKRKICIPNDSRRGFVLNENFEAAQNCYLMGPLVAGNLNKSFRVWHAESCSRIIHMSKKLAEVLVQA